MASQPEQGKIEPKTIFRHVYGVYPSIAMLAGMQLNVFAPLKDGPMSGARLAEVLDVPQGQQLSVPGVLIVELLRAEITESRVQSALIAAVLGHGLSSFESAA
jgi:hypothetical protein